MNLNWLYGPAWIDTPGIVFVRPLTVEKTTVTRIPILLRDLGDFEFSVPLPVGPMGREPMSLDWVLEATTFELRDLAVSGGGLDVRFGRDSAPVITYSDPALRDRAIEVADLLTTNGRPRLQVRRRLLPLAPSVGVLAGIAAYLWWVLSDRPGWPLGVLVGLLVIAAGVSLLDLGWRLLPRRRPQDPNVVAARPGQLANSTYTGHVIEETKRDEWLQRRWTTKRDFKIGIPAAVIGSVVTAAIVALFR